MTELPEICILRHIPSNKMLPMLYPSETEASADLHIMIYLRKLDNISELDSLGSSFMSKKRLVDSLFDRYNLGTPEKREFEIVVIYKEQLNQQIRSKLHEFLKRELLQH